MTRPTADDVALRSNEPSELERRACLRIDRRAGPGMRRGGRGGGGSQDVPDMNLYALSSLSALNFFATLLGGGEAGVATGFGFFSLARIDRFGTANRTIMQRFGVTSGWMLAITSAQQLVAYAPNNTTVSTAYVFQPSDLGKIFLLGGIHNGAGLVQAAVNRVIWNGAGQAGYTVANAAQRLGLNQSNVDPATGISVLASMEFRGVPSASQLAAYADAVRALGDLPDTIQGATITHHRSLRRALAGQLVTSGQTAPAELPDNVTLASADAMARQGSPTVVIIDPSTDGRTTYGVQGASSSSVLQTTADPGGVAGSSAGLHVMARARCDAFGTQVVVGRSTVTKGWRLSVSAGNWVATFSPAVGGQINSASGAVQVGKIVHVTLVHTGAGNTVQLWIDGVQVGSDVACSGFSPYAGRTVIGALNDLTFPASTTSVFQVCGGNTVPTPAEILQSAQESERTGALVPVPGKASVLWNIDADIRANGGPDNGVPAIVLDRIGTDHLSRMGTGLTVSQRVERIFSWDAAPILYGARCSTSNDHWSTAGGFAGAVTGWMIEALISIDTQGVASATRVIVGKRGASGLWPGWNLYTTGINTLLNLGIGGAASGVNSPTYTIQTSDVGKLLLVTGVWDPVTQRCRLLVKRAEVGTGTAFASPYEASSASFYIGRRSDGFAADGITIYGFRAGDFVPSTAEVMSAHDRLLANERMTASDYPGRAMSCLYRFDSGSSSTATLNDLIGAAHLARSGAPTIYGQYARSWGW